MPGFGSWTILKHSRNTKGKISITNIGPREGGQCVEFVLCIRDLYLVGMPYCSKYHGQSKSENICCKIANTCDLIISFYHLL